MAYLSHRLEDNGDGILLILQGEIDMSNSKDVRGVILGALETTSKLSVDLSGVDTMDSSGIAHLIEGYQRACTTQKTFKVTDASDSVRMVLRIARLETILLD